MTAIPLHFVATWDTLSLRSSFALLSRLSTQLDKRAGELQESSDTKLWEDDKYLSSFADDLLLWAEAFLIWAVFLSSAERFVFWEIPVAGN